MSKLHEKKRVPKRVLALPDLEQSSRISAHHLVVSPILTASAGMKMCPLTFSLTTTPRRYLAGFNIRTSEGKWKPIWVTPSEPL